MSIFGDHLGRSGKLQLNRGRKCTMCTNDFGRRALTRICVDHPDPSQQGLMVCPKHDMIDPQARMVA